MSVRAVITREVDDIVGEHGYVTPELLLERARDVNSATHDLYEWDDSVASEKYRLSQARGYIRIVREEIGEDEDGATKYVRAFTSAKNAGREEPGYLKTSEVLQSPISEAILLRTLKREIAGLKKKYGHLQEFGATVRGELGELAG